MSRPKCYFSTNYRTPPPEFVHHAQFWLFCIKKAPAKRTSQKLFRLLIQTGFNHKRFSPRGGDNTKHGSRLIPPHQSLTRQTACSFLPPEGKPSLRCANRVNRTSNRGLLSRFALIRRLRRHLPPRRGRLLYILRITKGALQTLIFGISKFMISQKALAQ